MKKRNNIGKLSAIINFQLPIDAFWIIQKILIALSYVLKIEI